ncbi:hypothetical protein CJ739_73 [Mariniflexile rhizosphaerae]|uniref:hypothetical protein n=1 Tax=unclassified Mariniflexile TaxID=2643887 RepID=UPI000E335527|nr:hypothetical protein [Mariniflexile sp. TRM1-10]AXP79173.1 hypothetical protein CJ739_73 [Mariniflexile sp. TRM1-10]
MTTRQNNSRKFNPFLLSEQVKNILKSNGFTSLFNYNDYEFFKEECKEAFNKALAIAERFMADADPNQNDLNDYLF